jgi:Zn-dependent peptidase ImmA (M78 family)
MQKTHLQDEFFSLIHELAHVAIGVNSLYNIDINTNIRLYNDIEKTCNAVAAEIIVPIELFKQQWRECKSTDIFKKISNLAMYFKVSEIVIARRAFDQKCILKHEYQIINDSMQSNFTNKHINKGGDSINNFFSRFDVNCLKIINNCVHTGHLSYTDAYRLTGLSRTFFDKTMNIVEKQF